jgi:RNA polymerase sigma-70 factor (ECF subfamily)
MKDEAQTVNQLVDHLFRREAGRIASRLTRVFGAHRLDVVEDAVQYALVQALQHWPYHGAPANPHAWLMRVASNRALDVVRGEKKLSSLDADDANDQDDEITALAVASAQDKLKFAKEVDDEQLALMFVCCHPALPGPASVALTLKVVCGFGVTEIARAFLTNDAAIAQRLVRAKRLIRERRIGFEVPGPRALPERLDPVLEVLYLFFTEGYAPTAGDRLIKEDLCAEAIRLTQLLAENPATSRPEVHALLALMLFQAARFGSRTDAAGDLLLLEEQDRTLWNRSMISLGLTHLARAGAGDRLTPYHLQAEIAAIHIATARPDDTSWPRILELYDLLRELQPTAVVQLNRAIALGKVEGPAAGLAALRGIAPDSRLERYPFLPTAEGEFLRCLGRFDEAAERFERALELARTEPERRFMARKLADARSASHGAHAASAAGVAQHSSREAQR